jgi:hypothetical protein
MVKAIAEQSGVRMPSFFGYMFKYSIPMLIPVFALVTLIFLRGGAEFSAALEDGSASADRVISAHIEPPPAATPAEPWGDADRW